MLTLEVGSLGTKFWRAGNGFIDKIEYTDGVKCWLCNGKYHREDGPAYEGLDPSWNEWWYNGTRIYVSSQEEFERALKLKAYW